MEVQIIDVLELVGITLLLVGIVLLNSFFIFVVFFIIKAL